jgi:uncharacterized tellurite resistance protein B-like protein
MNEQTLSTELKSHFLRLYQIAIADDEFDKLELEMLYHFAEEKGIDKKQMLALLMAPTDFSVQLPDTLEKKVEYLYDFACMIWADKKVTDDEYTALKKYCKKFEFLEENLVPLADFLIDCAKRNLPKQEILSKLHE